MAGATGARLDLSAEQEVLWNRVQELWRGAMKRDAETVRSSLHPRFAGWERGSPMPHDREFAIASITQHEMDVAHYHLHPMAVEVFDDVVGVVHYYFRALLRDPAGGGGAVSGRWSETWLRKGDTWLLIAAHGGSVAERD